MFTLHELGHYIPAKLFKIKVDKFFIFFDVKFALFKKKIGETTWGIGWLPLGAYVKMAGMIDESMDKEQMALPPKPWEFRSKPAWQRLIVMTGGVIVNFLLGWAVLSALLANYGDSYIPTQDLKRGIEVDSIAKVIGFKAGDNIISVDGKPIKKLHEARIEVLLGDKALIQRNGALIEIAFTPEQKKMILQKQPGLFYPRIISKIDTVIGESVAESIGLVKGDVIKKINGKDVSLWKDLITVVSGLKNKNIEIEINRNGASEMFTTALGETGKLGIGPSFSDLYITEDYSVLEAIPGGFKKAISTLSLQIRQFKLFFNKKTEAYKEVHGPIGIVKMMPNKWDNVQFWSMLAMFSIWLGFANILPIPALDGGHVMFLLYEIISGRKPSQRVLEIGQIVGFFLLMGSMLIITIFNDIL